MRSFKAINKMTAVAVAMTLCLLTVNITAYAQMQFEPGRKTTVTGRAENTKISAALITADSAIYYLSGMDAWNDEQLGKTVTVTGKLYSVDVNENMLVDSHGNRIQGIPGNTLYLRDPVIRKIK